MMQHHLLASLSQAGVGPDQIHMLDPIQREAIMNEARRKILAAERLDQKNRRRLAKMERMVCIFFSSTWGERLTKALLRHAITI